MKTISYWIRGYFGFSQKEASGFIILSALIIITLFAPAIYNKTTPSVSNSSLSDKKILAGLIAEIEEAKHTRTKPADSLDISSEKAKFYMFDPNTAALSDFRKLGIQKYLADRIIKYRDKGGKFRIKGDLKKIYGITADQFQKLQPFIQLPDSFEKTEQKNQIRSVAGAAFDINKADTFQLNRLKGIANVMSSRIIKYRDKLGGFVSQSQFSEVYSISPLAIEELKKRSFIERDFLPAKLNINIATTEILSAHPYIGKKLAVIIVNYRSQHGKFNGLDDMKQIISISPEQIEKLEPYLSF
jgi:competence protein ComEA